MQRILDRGAVAVQDDGVAQLKDGPVVVWLRPGHGAQDRRLLSPLDSGLVDCIDARGGRAPSAPSHDAGGDGGMSQDWEGYRRCWFVAGPGVGRGGRAKFAD